MKHYRVCIQAERREFEHLSSTISEAYGAIEDASIAFNLKIDMDGIMRVLVDMDRGSCIETNRHHIRIRVEDEGMNSKEAFGIENRLLGEISEAIDSGREFTVREWKIYRAFFAMQDLRLYLEEVERNNGRQAEDL